MSGAEALAVVGIIANVAQIVAFSGEVIDRLKWCLDKSEDAPRALKEIQTTLPTLTETVRKAEENAKRKITDDETDDEVNERNKSLLPLTERCEHEMEKLRDIITKVVPKADDSKARRLWVGLKTINNDSKMDRIRDRLQEYVQTIMHHQQAQTTSLLISHAQDQNKIQPEMKELLGQILQKVQSQPSQMPHDEIRTLLTKSQQPIQVIMDKLEAILSQTRKNSPEVPEKAMDAVDNIPPRGVKDFVPRPALFKKIEDLLSPSKTGMQSTPPTVVLLGIGGQGKTQLTMAYCRAAQNSKDFHSVFWVDASSEASLLRSYAEIAAKLSKTPPKFANDNELKDFIDARLKSWEQPWIMVFDNYDNPKSFEDLPKYMLQSKHGHFLVTSRSLESKRLCKDGFVVNVDGLTTNEAVDLFFTRAKATRDAKAEALAQTIVQRLGYHALAIDLSGSYVGDRGLPLDEFMDDFNRGAEDILNLEDEELPALWEYRRNLSSNAEKETALNVFTSWELSFKLLQPDTDDGERKAHILTLFAFLHLRVLSEKVFHAQLSNPKEFTPPAYLSSYTRRGQWEHKNFVKDLMKLENMSLLANYTIKDKAVITISLHPLVKTWIKLRQSEEKQKEYAVEATRMVERFLITKQNRVATFDMTQDEKAEALSYVEACQENLRFFFGLAEDGKDPNDLADDEIGVLGKGRLVEAGEIFALFLEYMGKIDLAHGLFGTIIKSREKALAGDKDLAAQKRNYQALLRSKSLFTEILRLQKNFKEAEIQDRIVYEARLKTLGPDDPETLWAAHDLGWDLEALGDVEKAEELQRKAYDGRREILGPTDALTLQSINNLAHTLRRQGKTLEALDLMRETLKIGREVFQTPHHSELLQFMSNLQDVLRFQSLLSEAESMAHASLKATCDEWGGRHLKAAASRGQLKDILWDLGKANEAEKVARENMTIMADSPFSTDISRIDDIAILLDTLSGSQMTSGQDKEEEILGYAEEALLLVRGLPEESLKLPSTLQDLIYLATGLEVLRASEQLTVLEPIIFENCKKVFGISDRNSVNSLVRLSSALRVQKKHEEANQECQKAIMELRAKVDEGDTKSTKSAHLAALSWLAVLYKHMGDQKRAMEVYDKAFDYVNQGDFIGKADYETLYSIQGLAEDIDDQRRCQKAERLHKAVLHTRRQKYGRHPCVDDSLYAYAWNLRLQDRLTEAEKICLEALDIAREFRGPHRNTMCITKRLAYLEEQLGKHEAAEGHYREVLKGFRALGTRHITRVTEALEDLQELLMEQRKWEEARALIQDAMSRRSQGWDRNMGHYAGLIRHLAIVTWEIGDGVEGLRLYREARRTYEKAWGLQAMPDGRGKQKLTRRINELLPGTENMEEEMRIEKAQAEEKAAAQQVHDAAHQEYANLDALDNGQKTPTPIAVQEVTATLQNIQQQMGPSHMSWDGATQSYQVSTKNNQEATVENGGLSLSRQTTLGNNSFPEAPSNEPSKLNETSATLDEVTRRMGEASLG